MKAYTIPLAEMEAERLAAALAWRGILVLPCTQQPPQVEVPQMSEVGYWGRLNNEQTELESSLQQR